MKKNRSIGDILDSVIEESVKSMLHQRAMNEKDKQTDTSNLFSDSGGEGDGDKSQDDSNDKEPSKTMDDETEKLASGDISSKDIIEKLNTIRSGKSFKDKEISHQLEQYIESMKGAEKTALLAFLKGIAQITTGEISADNAVEPDEHPADVEMKKDHQQGDDTQTQKSGGNGKQVHVKPNVVRGASQKKDVQNSSQEDTSAPKKVPITPKQR